MQRHGGDGQSDSGRCHYPHRPLTEALLQALRESDLSDDPPLARWLPMLEAVVPTGAERGDNRFPDSPPVRAEAVLHLLRLIAGTSGLLVVLEDLHWSDPDTLAVGGYLADNLPAEPVLCVATAAGLTPDNVEDVPTPYVYPDLDTAVRAQLSSGPAQRAIEYAGEQRTREAMIQAFGGCRRDDGSYRRTTRYTT